MGLLMDDDLNFGFAFNLADSSSNVGGQVQWAPYRSAAASSSGKDLSTYHFGATT